MNAGWLPNFIMERVIARETGSKRKFWTSQALPRNAFDLFAGRWASNLSEIDPALPSTGTPLFKMDGRPRLAASALGTGGRFDGLTMLDLGPLEGAHCYQMEMLGAQRVVGVESNAESFLRCLVVKNALSLDRTTFLLGDCLEYLKTSEIPFDVIFACGILYHMADPFNLIRLMALRTDRVFVWTSYYRDDFRFESGKPLPNRPVPYARDGLSVDAYVKVYQNRLRKNFWGGIAAQAKWLRLEDIVAAFRHYGFDRVDILETKDGLGGPAVSLAATRTR